MKFSDLRKCQLCNTNNWEVEREENGKPTRLCLPCIEPFGRVSELLSAVEFLEKHPESPEWCVPGMLYAAKILKARIHYIATGENATSAENLKSWADEVRPGRIILVGGHN